MRDPIRLFFVLLLIGLAPRPCVAQLGPNAAEIPSQPQVRPEPSPKAQGAEERAEPSMSQSVRPALDELLIAAARGETGQPQSADTAPARVAPQPVSPPQHEQRPGPVRSDVANDLRAGTESLPIGAPQERTTLIGAGDGAPASGLSLGEGWLQTVVALSGVILLILGLGQLYKRLAKAQGGLAVQLGAGGSAPTGILEVIGRYPVARGMTLVVLKFDRRVLLVAQGASTRGKAGRGASMQTLCELTDPEDVASVLLKARSASGDTIASSFERALREAEDITDDHLYDDYEPRHMEVKPTRLPRMDAQAPARTITSEEGDRAELWSSGSQAQAASGVLRKRLASMRKGPQG